MVVCRYDLGKEAVAYVRGQLGMLTFSRALGELPLDAGAVHAYLPPELPPERLLNFEASVHIPTGLDFFAEADERVNRDIADALWGRGPRCALFEINDMGDRQRDGVWTIPRLRYGSELYSYADAAAADRAGLKEALYWGNPYPFVGAVARLPDDLQGRGAGGAVSAEQLRALAAAVTMIIVGAYDDETKLLWIPRNF